MLQSLCPPVKLFNLAYPQTWFLKLNATVALNGVTAQLLMQAVLLNPLPVELRHLAHASTSRPQPYDDLCTAVLACYGHTYHPLQWNPEFQDPPPPPVAESGTRWPTAFTQPRRHFTDYDYFYFGSGHRASIPVLDHHDKIGDASTSTDLSNTRCVPSKLSAKGSSRMPAICTPSPTSTARDTAETSDSLTATMPHAMQSDNVIISPALNHLIAETSLSTMSHERNLPWTSTFCASWKQEPPSSSKSTAAEVPPVTSYIGTSEMLLR
ncbi:hypothetical protein HPB52_024910 [Rhipicephalus sanguineus]|uniref:Uncharacterized protein n=1 Tax=Rhipicephalus sanguineus TaxID=34632 RepID=A0A9D4TDR1_RHISA|nr:hypothetical protein HPB52_024910 [Rhipicephalus sanguineus]